MKNNKRSVIIISLGVLCILFACGLFVYNQITANRAYQISQETVEELSAIIAEEESDFPTDNYDRKMPKVKVDGMGYIGILEIEELELKLPVSAELDYSKLDKSPCLYSGSVYRDDMVIAAHNYENHFGRLSYLSIGSKINFTDVENNTYSYEVVNIETLSATQTDDMKTKTPTNDWDLTLFTCNYSGSKRVTIRCERID